MNRFPYLIALAAALATGAVQAAEPAAPNENPVTLRLSGATEHLSNGTPNWHETVAGLSYKFAPRHVVDISAGETHRFGLHDDQFAASYSAPLSSVLTATVDGNVSTTHRVLARHALGAQLQYEFAPAWLLHGGARSTSYDTVTVNQAVFMLEHYFSSFSWILGWRPTRTFDTTAHGIELRGSFYYGDRNAVTLIAAGGKEAASIPAGVALTDVRSVALTGRHWLDRNWAITYGAAHTRQGNLYSRNGINLGVQYAF
ncbi:YaiO family outer membrane beta-barrel protein [Janthinobacterium sp. 17J80-10]|uniref:YaiO family outer membrane beta-barrel protein n=1 Tax=Janthinobacterium sp. 17J80-10 TaxID=2497863 RepID=UPI0010057CB6|nr:YaiO family outer membrane beta-barrel protein [Janthinobacterium sp. 17J80-10]QAU34477.1 YaiO family outer membrane beta-barrel protein [Janthinobacterium sp. 17J80-10]